jgi:hypothetical protein
MFNLSSACFYVSFNPHSNTCHTRYINIWSDRYPLLMTSSSTVLTFSPPTAVSSPFPARKKNPWSESASKLYRQSDRPLSAKLVPTFAYRGCRGLIIGFLDRSRYFFFQVAPQLFSRGWVDPVRGPLFLRKSGSAGNWTRTSGYVARNPDH